MESVGEEQPGTDRLAPARASRQERKAGDHAELPFGQYPMRGRGFLGPPPQGDGSCRRGYGRAVFNLCGTACVYCGHELGDSYEAWLGISIDHVIPTETVKRLGYSGDWVRDLSNLVTSCRACNEFLNGYRVTDAPPTTPEGFFDLRDRAFVEKRQLMLGRHDRERAWYENWLASRRQ